MTRVAFLTLGTEALASSRVRAWSLASQIASASGWEAKCWTGPSRLNLLRLLLSPAWDVVVLQKWVPPRIVMALLRHRCRFVIFDCDDAIYLDDSRGSDHARRRIGGLLRTVDGITVSSHAIADDLRLLGHRAPTLVFPGPAPCIQIPSDADGPRHGVVWIGSAATEQYLALLQVQDRAVPSIRAIGATMSSAGSPPIEAIPWSPEVARKELTQASVGIYIESEGEWETRKAAYKILEYIAHGVVPVAMRTDAAEILLGADYEYYIEGDSWDQVAERAMALNREQRVGVLRSLQERLEDFSVERYARVWMEWLRDIQEAERCRT